MFVFVLINVCASLRTILRKSFPRVDHIKYSILAFDECHIKDKNIAGKLRHNSDRAK